MKPVLRPLLVLHPDAGFRESIRRTSGDAYAYSEFADWNALETAVREATPGAILVVDPYEPAAAGARGGRRPVLARRLQKLLREHPLIAVLAAIEVMPERSEDLRTLARWGVVQIIALGHDDTPRGIAIRLDTARGRPLRSLIEQVLPSETSGRAYGIIAAAADTVVLGRQGSDLAASLHVSARTLQRWCHQAGLPPARTLLAWMRVLVACQLLDDPERTVTSIAKVCGYSGDGVLNRTLRMFLGAGPMRLRERGAFGTATAAFQRDLEAARKRPGESVYSRVGASRDR